MTISLKHKTQAAGTDAGNGEIAKTEWNEEHDLTMATARLLGRTTAGDGAAEEISVGSGLSLSGGELVATGVPPGSLMAYAGTTEPTGWLLCYGQAVSRTTYADLFAAIGTTYGVGDGSTTFTLPDLRGRVIAGQDDMGGVSANRLTGLSGGVDGDVLGATGGAESHTLVTAELASHTHSVKYNTVALGGSSTLVVSYITSSGSKTGTNAAIASGSGSAHNNVQPTIVLNWLIKI